MHRPTNSGKPQAKIRLAFFERKKSVEKKSVPLAIQECDNVTTPYHPIFAPSVIVTGLGGAQLRE